jgi:DNA helicase II / ATP-dependent DNA helicase PcrA
MSRPDGLLLSLNPEQLQAVTLPAEHALILAGAGSGKTRVLTTRIAWLLHHGYATPGGIMAVTFTNKAAREMVTRLSAQLPISVRGMWIGTFHGLCNRLLRAHWKLASLPQSFQILDTQDQLSAVKRVCKQHGVDEERFPPKQLQWFIAGCKEDGERPRDVVARDEETRRKVEIYALYEDQCQRDGVVDFAELMLRSYELLRDNGAVREHYQRRFRHILIDEFQDTNRLQYAWIKMLSGHGAADADRYGADGVSGGNAVMAVGDDDQSIYAFRGARVGNMADFVREFGVQHQIKLERNYRSFANILNSANALISHNSTRLGKNLRTDQGPGEPVRVVEAPSDFSEAQWLVDEVRQLVRAGDVGEKEVAVLYRSNAQSRVIETALFNAGIPYRVYGGLRFFERAEIKHALSYLRLLENPRDDTSFLRVVNFPPRGIGARTLEQLQDAAREMGCPLHDAVGAVKGKAGANLGAFVAGIDVLRERMEGKTLRDIMLLVLEHSGLIEHYKADREGADRVENLEELVNAAESFVSLEGFGREAAAMTAVGLGQSPASQGLDAAAATPLGDAFTGGVEGQDGETLSPLAAFLTHAALESGDNQASAGQDAVQLMTVHSAKGLEFDVVFITGLEEGLFPHENSMSDRTSLEEERRLMYVAITRARKRLYLSHSQTRMLHGQTRYNLVSRFLDELPEEALKWITPRQAGAWGQASRSGGGGFGYGGGGGSAGQRPLSGTPVLPTSRWGQGASLPAVVASSASAGGGGGGGAGLRAGQRVFHTKFGEGQVLTLEGSGDDARAQVQFGRHGTKWLALSVAKLTPIP